MRIDVRVRAVVANRLRRNLVVPTPNACLPVLLCGLILLLLTGCGTQETPNRSVTASIETETTLGDENGLADGMRTATLQDPKFPTVRLLTTAGALVVQLDLEKAPITTKNFLWYANNGHYDGTLFHQVIPGYMVLGGGYTKSFVEKPTQFWIRNEAYNGLKNSRGTIAMARRPDETDSSTCQFFFNLVDNPHLDHKSRSAADQYGYCVFGRIVEGIEILDKIGRVPITDKDSFKSTPQQPVVIEKVIPSGS